MHSGLTLIIIFIVVCLINNNNRCSAYRAREASFVRELENRE